MGGAKDAKNTKRESLFSRIFAFLADLKICVSANQLPSLRSSLCLDSFSPAFYRAGMAAKKIATRGSSAAMEDYLERILELINSKGYARVVDIASSLDISQASVTNMVQRLDAEGMLKYEKYRGLVLTTAGEELARNITHKHQLLTDFLKLLGIDDDVIYHDVEGMEHHISPPTLRALEALTAHLQDQPEALEPDSQSTQWKLKRPPTQDGRTTCNSLTTR
ncbi:MAG: transcriptional regulator MntR [Chthoniobacteraceae bacterium]